MQRALPDEAPRAGPNWPRVCTDWVLLAQAGRYAEARTQSARGARAAAGLYGPVHVDIARTFKDLASASTGAGIRNARAYR